LISDLIEIDMTPPPVYFARFWHFSDIKPLRHAANEPTLALACTREMVLVATLGSFKSLLPPMRCGP
jgi:hypothetical protein